MKYLSAEKKGNSYQFVVHTDIAKMKDITQTIPAVYEKDKDGNDKLVTAEKVVVLNTIPDPDYVREFQYTAFNPDNPPMKYGVVPYTEAEYNAMVKREIELLIAHEKEQAKPPISIPLTGFM